MAVHGTDTYVRLGKIISPSALRYFKHKNKASVQLSTATAYLLPAYSDNFFSNKSTTSHGSERSYSLIYFSTESEDSFNDLSLFLKDYEFILGLIVLSFCILWYHILSGVRHLIMDAHIGESLIASKYSAIFTISLWVITTSFVFWRIFS